MYIPNAYFVYIKDNDGKYFWCLKLQLAPNLGKRTIIFGRKKRKKLTKMVKDIERFKLKYGIGFLCNCYLLSHLDYLCCSIKLEKVPMACSEVN